MDYKRHYDHLIKKYGFKSKPEHVYTERHHIVPRCLGGTDDKSNLIYLEARAHLISHLLLAAMHNWKHVGLNTAVFLMANTQKRGSINNRLYARAKQLFSTSQKGMSNSNYKGVLPPTEEFINQIEELLRQGKTQEEISSIIGCDKGHLCRFIANNKINNPASRPHKIDQTDIRIIRWRLKHFEPIKEIAECFGVSKMTIHRINNGSIPKYQ